MSHWKIFYSARDVHDAVQALQAAPRPSRFIAGGTDLLLDLQQGRYEPVHTLVDITHIPEMTALEVRAGRLYIGAARPLNQVVGSPLVYEHARALYEAGGLIGGPQVRNTATLGGNVSHALPAGDGTIALTALDAEVEVASAQGRQRRALGELFLGPGRSALGPAGELLVGFYLPLRRAGEASAFRRVMRPQGVAIAILNVAVWLRRRDECVEDIRIAVGPAGPLPLRARAAEDALRGRPLDAGSQSDALQALLGEVRFRTSPHRATAGYRLHVVETLLDETLQLAWERARLAEPV